MGFFSQDCHSCGHPALSSYVTIPVNAWMSDVVSVSPEGEVHMGEYDGYGRVGGAEYAVGEGGTVWHRACWELAGRPLEFRGESRHSSDQGFFFEEDAHNVPDPRITGQELKYAGPARHSILGDR